ITIRSQALTGFAPANGSPPAGYIPPINPRPGAHTNAFLRIRRPCQSTTAKPRITADPSTENRMTAQLKLHSLGTALGTEVRGIDLSQPADEAPFAWIAAAFAEHPVLVFRDQRLGAGDLAAFGRRFGVPRRHALVSYRHHEHPEVSWLRNVDEAGNID